MMFTDRCGNLIGDHKIPGVVTECPPAVEDDGPNDSTVSDDVRIPGVDMGTQDPQAVRIDDPNIDPQDDFPIPAPSTIPPTMPKAYTSIDRADVPESVGNEFEPVSPPELMEATLPPPRHSTRVWTKPSLHVPTMSGTKHDCVATQAELNALHPNAHMFTQHDFCQMEPDIVAAVMTQSPLKAGLKEWGE